MIKANIGSNAPSLLGMEALLDFSMEMTLDGEALSATEVTTLMQGMDGLQLIRGRWVEVDRKKLGRLLERFQAIERAAADQGLPFAEAMRLTAGAALNAASSADDADWSQITSGPWLADTLHGLRQPEGLAQVEPGPELKATLRPYQQAGVRWLYLLTKLGLGACLADDMGLGKTIQVLALLLVLKRESQGATRPSLLVAPASLLANWQSEAERFAPGLRVLVVHSSALPAAELRALDAQRLGDFDLVITSYGTLSRAPALMALRWRLAVVDEAQAIKNPGSRQTQ
jgi:non-specific serine/threonine protein kinase